MSRLSRADFARLQELGLRADVEPVAHGVDHVVGTYPGRQPQRSVRARRVPGDALVVDVAQRDRPGLARIVAPDADDHEMVRGFRQAGSRSCCPTSMPYSSPSASLIQAGGGSAGLQSIARPISGSAGRAEIKWADHQRHRGALRIERHTCEARELGALHAGRTWRAARGRAPRSRPSSSTRRDCRRVRTGRRAAPGRARHRATAESSSPSSPSPPSAQSWRRCRPGRSPRPTAPAQAASLHRATERCG